MPASLPDADKQLMQKSSWSDSRGSTWWYGRSGTGRWNWNSGWDEAAWSSAGWQEGWQDDGGEDSPKDSGHDADAPEPEPWENCADGRDAKGADDQPPAPDDPAAGPAGRGLAAEPAEDDQDVLRRLHEAALRRFHQDQEDEDELELGSDDEAPAGARTRMLVDHDIDAGIAEFDPATGGVTCKVCNITLNSKSQWADHQKGKKHFKKLSAEERRRRCANVQKLDKTNVPAASFQ